MFAFNTMEYILSTSKNSEKSEGMIFIWDPKNGTVLETFKQNTCDVNSVAFLPHQAIMTAQSNSSSLFYWNWVKSQPNVRSSTPEKLSCIFLSHDGLHLFGGSFSGRLYIWEVASGNMLRSFEAHYKKINVIKITDDDNFLISGGEDSVINVWNILDLLGDVIFSNEDGGTSVSPIISWSDHALPITDIYCGSFGINSRLFSTSMDRTCKIFDIPSGTLLCSILFPTGLNHATVDFCERNLYVGGVNGNIYKVDLSQKSIDSNDNIKQVFEGHSQAITSLVVTLDGKYLISGSLDGTCRVWDTLSRQSLRSFNSHRSPVTNLMLVVPPLDLLENAEKRNMKPLPTLKKYSTITGKETSISIPVHLNGLVNEFIPKNENSLFNLKEHISESLQQFQASGGAKHKQAEIEKLQQEVTQLKEQNLRWKIINNELYHFSVGGVIGDKMDDS